MNIPMENSTASPMELDIGHTVESFQQFLESQKDLFHSQIDQLEKIVVTQCKLTGVNPLSQEMAAGALSIKIGKRPRDLLNPKAVKYMQSVFSIKDTISKKETREISALCGVTVTQVREFFAGQRSRVRKVVRLSREKSIRFSACKTSDDGSCVKSESDVPVSHETSSNLDQQNVKEEETSLNPVHKIIKDAETFLNSEHKNVKDAETFLNSEHKTVKDAETCSTSQEETIPGLDSSEIFFVENIFNLMRKEDTFSGQVKLLQSILRIHNSAVLNWFLTKGGMLILAKWLSEAALEEQTTVLLVILKVLCRLPLHKALPAQMSAILQTVNRLRFYRTSDISNRAKVLLSRWSKLFVRSQTLKKLSPASARSDAQKEMIHNQRISEILGDNSWQSKLEIPELFSLNENFSESCRKLENAGAVKLLPPPSCDSYKKSSRNITSSNTVLADLCNACLGNDNKERRKVQLVEQPSRNVARSGSAAKMASVKHSRPMSADDIQKAKMRAIFMQSKYGLRGESSTHNNQQKTETLKISSDISECQKNCSSITINKLEDAKTSVMEKQQDQKPASVLISQTLPPTEYTIDPQSSLTLQQADLQSNACQNDNVLQPSCAENIDLKPSVAPQEHDFEPTVTLEGPDLKLKSVLQEPNSKSCMACEVSDLMLHSGLEEKLLWERLKKLQIPWHMPPEIRVSSQWSLGAGENSKEIEVQTERIRREKETVYQSNQDIPSDPKEPWDVEMDYDDSLTPEIPTEQPPDGQSEASPEGPTTDATPDVTSATAENSKNPEPDLELLAVLLKNPDLVFALTSSQGSNISNGQIVQVLDMLKASGLSGSVNGLAVNGAEQQKSILSQNPVSPSPPTPLSLPSPTPSSLPSPTPDPSSRWSLDSAMTLKVPGMTRISLPDVASASTALSPVPSYAASIPNLVSHQAPVSVASVPERSASTRSLPPQSSVSAPPWKEVPPEVPKAYQEASIPARPLATVTQLTQNASSTLQQFPAQRLGAANHGRPGNIMPAPVSLGVNHPAMERPVTTYPLPSTASTAPRTQQAFPEPMPYSPQYTPWPRNYPQISTQESRSEPGHSRPNGFASNRASNAHFVANQSNYNAYLAGPSAPVFETWSPERVIPQAQPDGNFSTRRNSGWGNERTERSRHSNNQTQRWGSRTGNKRWHERGRRY